MSSTQNEKSEGCIFGSLHKILEIPYLLKLTPALTAVFIHTMLNILHNGQFTIAYEYATGFKDTDAVFSGVSIAILTLIYRHLLMEQTAEDKVKVLAGSIYRLIAIAIAMSLSESISDKYIFYGPSAILSLAGVLRVLSTIGWRSNTSRTTNTKK